MAGTLRWCKKCKVTFGEDKCPAGHAIFLYTKKIPVDSGDTAPTKNAGSPGGTAATSGETKAAGLQSSAGARTGESIADRIERQKKERFEASDEFKAMVASTQSTGMLYRTPFDQSSAEWIGGMQIAVAVCEVIALGNEVLQMFRQGRQYLMGGGGWNIVDLCGSTARCSGCPLFR